MRRTRCCLFVLAMVTLCAGTALAEPAGYTHALGIGIRETSGTTLANYQVRLQINTAVLVAAGTMRADGFDMVFTAADCGGAVYPHWIESGMNTASTVVWVKVPSLPASATTRVLMWHGNPAATDSGSVSQVFVGGTGNAPISSTNQITGGTSGGSGNSQRGFHFRPNAPVLVVDFGKFEPTGSVRTVTLFDVTSQAILRQAQVSGAASVYSYAAIPPIWLAAGHDYTLQLYSGAADGYFYQTSSQIASDLTYVDMLYCNNCSQNTFPTVSLNTYHYGYPDLRYFKRTVATSEPVQVDTNLLCTESATCDADCTAVTCGDGVMNTLAGEACDDGNTSTSDGCVAGCKVARCGDGFVRDGMEACDDGNTDDSDGCLSTCVVARCGDGVIEPTTEECDDGAGNGGDGSHCRADCTEVLIADGCCSSGRGAPVQPLLLALLVGGLLVRPTAGTRARRR